MCVVINVCFFNFLTYLLTLRKEKLTGNILEISDKNIFIQIYIYFYVCYSVPKLCFLISEKPHTHTESKKKKFNELSLNYSNDSKESRKRKTRK